jgi:outer membrane protein assembly factor BamC
MFFKKILFLFLFLVGCSATEEILDDITAPDYVNSSKAKNLEIPPDLSELEQDSAYNVPGEAKSYRDYLDRERKLNEKDNNNSKLKVVENPEGMKIVKSGNLRWLVVKKEADLIWPHVKDFWEELGFRVLISNKRTGIIETEWMDTEDIKLDKVTSSSNFDKWLDSLSGFADKRKFRTRVEIAEDGSTEIYISQRSAEAAADQHSRILKDRGADYNPSTIFKIEEYKSDEEGTKEKRPVSEQREIDDYEIDSELLTRLMIKLGASDLNAKEKVNNPQEIIKAELVNNQDNAYIKMYDPFDRSWRRLGLALDIIGFVTEDKNRSEGIYFVRFGDIDLPSEVKEEEEGLIDSLIFWDDDKKASQETEAYNNDLDNTIPNEEEYLDGKKYTGIQAPEVKPIDEDYIPDENNEADDLKAGAEETWVTKIWPSWGDEDQHDILPANEKRYRIRIKPFDDTSSIVFLDYPNGKRNISKEARKVLTIINDHLK